MIILQECEEQFQGITGVKAGVKEKCYRILKCVLQSYIYSAHRTCYERAVIAI